MRLSLVTACRIDAMGITVSRLGCCCHLTPVGLLVVLIGLAAGPAQAQDALVRQPLDIQQKVTITAPPSAAAAGESFVSLPNGGLMRVAKVNKTATLAPLAVVPSGDSTHWLSPTQALRLSPGQSAAGANGGAVPSSPIARVAPIGTGLEVRKVGSVQMLEHRGQAPVLLPILVATAADPATARAPLPPGVKVVDLPPGAVVPDGPPAALTLYRRSRQSAADTR